MIGMRRWSTIAIASGVLVGACVDLQAYTCSDDAQCAAPTPRCDQKARSSDATAASLSAGAAPRQNYA